MQQLSLMLQWTALIIKVCVCVCPLIQPYFVNLYVYLSGHWSVHLCAQDTSLYFYFVAVQKFTISNHKFLINAVVDSTCRDASPSLRKYGNRRMVLIEEILIQNILPTTLLFNLSTTSKNTINIYVLDVCVYRHVMMDTLIRLSWKLCLFMR